MTQEHWQRVAERLGAHFGDRAAAHDAEDRFVADNYAELREQRVPSMIVPRELGGGGAIFAELCELLYELGRHCASTALALSMHQHLVAAMVVRAKRGQPTPPLLTEVARREAILVSTGASDWIESNGSAERVDGGYRVSGRKVFGSGSPAADFLVTSFAVEGEPDGPSVIHCSLPLAAEGVRRLDDWHTLGMRGTGSHSLVLEGVFVPDSAIALRRPRAAWHPVWDVVLGVAPPIFMAPYVGLARAAKDQALAHVREKPPSAALMLAVGRMESAFVSAEVAWRDMLRLAGDFDFDAGLRNSNAQLVRKTLVARAVEQTVASSLEVVGGASFFCRLPFERMWRDVQAAHHHPFPETKQQLFSGGLALGVETFWQL